MQRVSAVYLAKGARCKMTAMTICWSVNKPKGAKDGDDNDRFQASSQSKLRHWQLSHNVINET
jgi:hypothetical protein